MDKSLLSSLKRLEEIVVKISATMATKDDLRNFATKDDLKKHQKAINEDISEVVSALFIETDKQKANRSELKHLEVRVEHLEDKVAS